MASNLTLHKENYLDHQWKFLTNTKPIKSLIGGLGSGKTHVFLHETFKNHITKLNKHNQSNGWIVYPTYDLAEELFVEPFKAILRSKCISFDYNISKHRFTTPYGRIKLYQLQKPHRIIGAELTYIGFDEFDIESWKNCDIAFKKAIGRMRGAEDCVIYIVSSPEGYHYCHKIFVEDMNDDRYIVHGKTSDNLYLPQAYIHLLESNYSDTLLKAYRDGQFVNLQQGSTYEFKRENNVKECNYDRSLPVRIGLDWNVSPMAAVCFHTYQQEPKVRVFGEVSLTHGGMGDLLTERMCATIKDKYPNSRYVVYPDASGFARHTSAMFSDIDILKRSGFEVKVRAKNPPVVNRVNSVNKRLQEGLIIDPKCKELIRDLEKVVNKTGTREIDKTNKLLTHFTDALGYAVEWEYPIIKPTLGAIPR